MNPTQKARRADALRLDVEHVYRRDLCDMVVNREADLEDARAEIAALRQCIADLWPRAAFTMNDANRESWLQRFAELDVEVEG